MIPCEYQAMWSTSMSTNSLRRNPPKSLRQGFEARIATLQHDTQQLRTHQQEQQQAVAVLRAERQGLQIQLERANGEVKEHLCAVYTLREQLAVAREMASREHMEAAIAAELLDKAEDENVRLDTPNGELFDEVAALKAQMMAASGSTRTPRPVTSGSGRGADHSPR